MRQLSLGSVVLVLLMAGATTSGCVAVAVPVAAGAMMGRKAIDRDTPSERAAKNERKALKAARGKDGVTMLPSGSVLPPPSAAVSPPVASRRDSSGEGAAATMQVWRTMVRYVADKAITRPRDSAVLADGATLDAPEWVPCGKKPAAVVFDLDGTMLFNLAGGQDAGFAEERWKDWDRAGGGKVIPAPGAAAAFDVMRTMGVAMVFTSARSASDINTTVAVIEGAGLGPVKPGETLFLHSADSPVGKDARRAGIASRYCVLALGGDQLGDFSDLFNSGQATAEQRGATLSTGLGAKWGAGWFMLPNPVYGPGYGGGDNPDNRPAPSGQGVN